VDGKEIHFLNALDLWTIGGKERMIGNFVFECDFLKNDHYDGKIVGFENHSGRTYLGPGVKASRQDYKRLWKQRRRRF